VSERPPSRRNRTPRRPRGHRRSCDDAQENDSGMDTRPGWTRNQWKLTVLIIEVADPERPREDDQQHRRASRRRLLNSAPMVLNRFQNSEYRIVGRLAEAATANAAHQNAMFCRWRGCPPRSPRPRSPAPSAGPPAPGVRAVCRPFLIMLAYTSCAKRPTGDAAGHHPGSSRRHRRDQPQQHLAAQLKPATGGRVGATGA